MVSEATLARSNRDWRIWFGVASTVFWLWLGLLYIAIVVGWSNFISQPADSLGGFLEGAFAPLAFLWLVIGFFLQQRELRQNNEAIRALDAIIMRIMDGLMAIPAILLAIAVVSVFNAGVMSVIIAIVVPEVPVGGMSNGQSVQPKTNGTAIAPAVENSNEHAAKILNFLIGKLAQRAGIPKPKVGVSKLSVANAFAFGRTVRDGRVCLTQGIQRLLNKDELKAVIGHEISHLKHRDMMIITLLSVIP